MSMVAKKRAAKKKKVSGLTSFWGIYRKIVEDPKKFFTTIAFDVVFIIILLTISNRLYGLLPVADDPGFRDWVLSNVRGVVFGMVLVYFGLILLYSIFKFIDLFYVQKYFEDKIADWKRFGGFYGMNILFSMVFFLVFVMMVILLGISIKQDHLVLFRNFFLFIVALVGYLLLNSMHSFYRQGCSGGASARNALQLVFRKPKPLFGVVISLIFTGVIGYGLSFTVDLLLHWLFLRVMATPYYVYYWSTALLVFIIVFLIIAFHRVFVYARVKELDI